MSHIFPSSSSQWNRDKCWAWILVTNDWVPTDVGEEDRDREVQWIQEQQDTHYKNVFEIETHKIIILSFVWVGCRSYPEYLHLSHVTGTGGVWHCAFSHTAAASVERDSHMTRHRIVWHTSSNHVTCIIIWYAPSNHSTVVSFRSLCQLL